MSSTGRSRSSHAPTRRASSAYELRLRAAELALSRPHPTHLRNADERLFRSPSGHRTYVAVFTKGLRHCPRTGLLARGADYDAFVRAIRNGSPPLIAALPLGPGSPGFVSRIARGVSVRGWESMAAGAAYDLQGPDARALTMPPAPRLESDELHFEMAELFWMALFRDVPLSWFSQLGRRTLRKAHVSRVHRYRPDAIPDIIAVIDDAISGLNDMPWLREYHHRRRRRHHHHPRQSRYHRNLSSAQQARRRFHLSLQTLFRGITPGDDEGPYLSQFLIIGTTGLGHHGVPEDGYIQYGGMRMDQRVRVAKPGKDYMTTWAAFLDVQNGADVRGKELYSRRVPFRFITTPRDLATYVHHDAAYQAYLNACLVLLDMHAPFDQGLPFTDEDAIDKQSGFALFGPPHVLTLLAEVTTRALKAVRFQKFNVHRRPRPEAVGGVLDRYIGKSHSNVIAQAGKALFDALDKDLLYRVMEENELQNQYDDGERRVKDLRVEDRSNSALLPMAYPEGSPMHPSYGAGHATVGGACVTILKAFFDTDFELPHCFVVNEDGSALEPVKANLTVGGELNKLCSNIAIGRNWAGVHYFSDYYESILLGEQVALGILEEQKLTYRERFSMTVPLFDGSERRV